MSGYRPLTDSIPSISRWSGGYGCSWVGEFRLPDGKVTRTEIGFTGGSQPLSEGHAVPALDSGSSFTVFSRSDWAAWVRPALGLLTGLLFLGISLIGVSDWRRLRRHGRIGHGRHAWGAPRPADEPGPAQTRITGGR